MRFSKWIVAALFAFSILPIVAVRRAERMKKSEQTAIQGFQDYYSQELRGPGKNYTPGSSQPGAGRAENLLYTIEI